tara:strand:- start:110 stop:421 length:312 start_codon:yes stop_codon:yes gene_type:complete
MAVYHANITLERDTYCVHLQDEDEMFFIVPATSDGSENWTRLQSWLDEGNTVADDMSGKDTHYIAQRKAEYPSYADQFDKIFHEGVDAWKAEIQAVKASYPKP